MVISFRQQSLSPLHFTINKKESYVYLLDTQDFVYYFSPTPSGWLMIATKQIFVEGCE